MFCMYFVNAMVKVEARFLVKFMPIMELLLFKHLLYFYYTIVTKYLEWIKILGLNLSWFTYFTQVLAGSKTVLAIGPGMLFSLLLKYFFGCLLNVQIFSKIVELLFHLIKSGENIYLGVKTIRCYCLSCGNWCSLTKKCLLILYLLIPGFLSRTKSISRFSDRKTVPSLTLLKNQGPSDQVF